MLLGVIEAKIAALRYEDHLTQTATAVALSAMNFDLPTVVQTEEAMLRRLIQSATITGKQIKLPPDADPRFAISSGAVTQMASAVLERACLDLMLDVPERATQKLRSRVEGQKAAIHAWIKGEVPDAALPFEETVRRVLGEDMSLEDCRSLILEDPARIARIMGETRRLKERASPKSPAEVAAAAAKSASKKPAPEKRRGLRPWPY